MAVVSVEEGLPQEKPVDTTIDDKGKGKEAEGGKKAKAKKEKLPTVSLFSLWRYSPGIYRFLAVIAAIFSLGAGVLQPIVIIVMGDMLNGFGGSADSGGLDFFSLTPKQISEMLNMYGVDLAESFKPTMLKFIYFGIAILVASYFAHAFWVFTSEKTTRIVRERYVQAILRQDIGWHDKSEEGSLATRLALDTQLVQDGIGEKLGVILQSFAAFVGGFVVAFVKGWKLALVIFACMPILMAAGVFIGLKIKTYTVKTQDVYARAGGIAEQAFSGIRTVYAFSLQNRFVKKYDDNLIAAEKCDTEKGVVFGVSVGLFIFALYGILGLAFWYGSRLVIDGEMLGGDVMVVFFGMLIGAMSLMGIPPNVQAVTTAQGAAHKVFGVIERNPTIDSLDEKGATAEKLEGFIEFRDVKFHYPTRPNVPVLKGLNLVIKPGQTVAFVGPSGSGKSTSVALVQRFYDAVEGEVLIDGKNVKEYNLSWLRKNIGVVGQEPVLFNMTIKENILMGTSHPVSEERLFDVCKMANCHNFISMLPNGYDTQVGEHGGMLSGGQKQRIAIARALIKNPQVLLLDEATSALDTASERIVQKALDVAAQNRTTITIAHRLSTIRNADLICVMAQGELVEQGTHNELLAKEGVYYSLVQKQKINMKEEGEEKQAGADEEVEVFNVPNQEALLKKPTGQVAIAVGDASAMLSMPDARTMTHHANARRAAEKKGKKAKLAALPKFEISRMMNILKGQKHFLTMGVGAGLIAGALSPVFAFLLAKVVVTLLNPNPDSISPGPLKGANLYSFLFAVVGLAGLISWWMQIASFEKIGAVVTRKLRRDTFAALLRQEIGFYDMPHHSMGALTSRLATDASNVYKMVVAWGEVAQFIATIGAGLAIGFAHAPALTGIILCLAPFSVYASYYQSKQMKGFEDKTRAAYEEASEIASEAIKEVRTVAALTRERWFLEKYSASLDHPEKLGYVKAYRDSFAFSLQHSIGQFMAALGFYVGITYIQDGSISFEQLFVTMMTVMISANSIGNSSTFMSNIDKGKIAAINIFEFLDRVSSINPDVDGYIPPEGEFNPDFNFENIAFTYPARPDQPIFTGEFNVSGKKNQTLALVGASGCGKSTTIGMLERWYDCAAGVVSVGGHDVKSYQLKAGLRRHMALVGQEPVLFDMSIGENILWGVDRDNVTQEEVERAATLANIHNFVSNLPDGYMTRVGDKGSQLSGGQKQRIAIARALIREPKILLLDEATSALDSESEKVVQEAIDKASEGRTTVTIAHRLSTIQNADQIAVVSGGKVVELGRHFELLALNGIYADLVKQQDLGSAPPS